MIDTKHIVDFRNEINDLSYLRNQLLDYNGISLWNVVCSAMDWVETSANWLSYHDGPEVSNQPYCDSMNVMFYLSAVDMLYAGVAQLYRVFYGKLCDISNAILMNGETGVFSDIRHCEDDKDYFKEIRAIFGEHSVDLRLEKLLFPKEEREEHKGERWFASWSYSFSGGCPSEIFIYSRKPGETAERLSLDMDEVRSFAEKVYATIPAITKKANELEKMRIDYFKNKTWPDFENNDAMKVAFLLKENQERTGSIYYRNALREIDLILKSDLSDELVLKLKEKAKVVLSEMEKAFRSVVDTDCINMIEPYPQMDYSLSKAYTSLYVKVIEDSNDSDYMVWGGLLKDFVSDVIIVPEGMSLEDQYVLITAALVEIEENLNYKTGQVRIKSL